MIKDLNINTDVKGQTEDALQQKCFTWFWNTYPSLRTLLFAVPNGGKRNPREAERLKLTGVVSGVSDLILLFRGTAYFIELKRDDKATQSDNQKKWQKKIEAEGFEYFLIHNLTDFKNLTFRLINF